MYCALYVAAFAALASALMRNDAARGGWGQLRALWGVPAGWVALEFMRATLVTGFPWNPLGVTQAGALPLIQCAEWGGVYAVSFLVAMANVALALSLLSMFDVRCSMFDVSGVGVQPACEQTPPLARFRTILPLLLCLAVLLLAWIGGVRAIRRYEDRPGTSLRVALIQLNIPQFEKMVEECFGEIERRLQHSTAAAVEQHHPELVIWPETAVPTFVRGVPSTEKVIADLLALGVPLLVGAMDFERQGERCVYFNSSFLFDPERGLGLPQSYAKRHLVCFGEYVPLGDVFPFLRRLTPIEESFAPGTIQTVFRLDASPRAFAVLICFEDTVAALARAAVRAGARLLVNQTNDAWFDPSWASRQHMLQCVFRCVENRVPAVRSSNTGVTCHIDRAGRVLAGLPPTRGTALEPQCLARTVLLPDPEMALTFYCAHGDLFAAACVVMAALAVLARRRFP